MEYSKINGMPLDGRIRPVLVYTGSGNSIITIAVISDGKGNAYDCENDVHKGCDKSRVNPENLIDPSTICFHRGLSGMEF